MQKAQMLQWLDARRANGLFRTTSVVEPLSYGRLKVDGREYLNFSGNDYLGLATDPQLRAGQAEAMLQFGSGSTGSPLVTGFHPVHQRLSETLCDWLHVEAVLLFSSGFAANQAMIAGLVGADETLVLDKLSHASMIDAATMLSSQDKRGYKRFLHNDFASLQRIISAPLAKSVVATEGVFSMDGDSPDLTQLFAICQPAHIPVLLDDAHGLGVHGPEGAGTMSAQGLCNQQLQCLMANFGKALGAHGGFLAADADTIEYLRQTSRHYIYSTALPPAQAEAVRLAVDACRREQWRRDKLRENIEYFRQLAIHYQLKVLPSSSAIQPLLVGDSQQAMRLSQQLKHTGIWVTAIRPPTVPQGQARLRITLSTSHTKEDLQCLMQALQQAQ